jgi:acetylornithine/LysW-gamma-L-lysine aminotransferase
MNFIEMERRHESGIAVKWDIVLVRGLGARLWDEQGNSYIDCNTGHGVAILGHCHPKVVAAIQAQAATLVTSPDSCYNDVRAQFLERLTAAAPAGLQRVFLCNSGAESIEGALKFARYSTGRKAIVATMRGFHGRTMGALSATHNPHYKEPFEPLVPGFTHVPYNNLAAADKAITSETAAVLVEPVQGEGGVRPATAEYLQGLRRLCDERGALLILDEVQTGMGRTGKLFACQHFGVTPDILCLGKGIGGGVPMGAILIGPRLADLKPGLHGSTFGGNPLACAAGLAVLDVLQQERLPERAAELGAYVFQRLAGLQTRVVREVRGLGLMIGIELTQKSRPYIGALLQRGILSLPAGPTVLRLLPPLMIPEEDLRYVMDMVADVLSQPLAGAGAEEE